MGEVDLASHPPEVGGPLKPQSRDTVGKGFSHRAPLRPLQEKGIQTTRDGAIWPKCKQTVGENASLNFMGSFCMAYTKKQKCPSCLK